MQVLYLLQGLDSVGVPNVVMNYVRGLYGQVEADFAVVTDGTKKEEHIPELLSHGCHIFRVTPFTKSMIGYYRDVAKIIRNGHYDVVHDNNKYFAFLSLRTAKSAGVPIRICHVHNTVVTKDKGIAHQVFIKMTSILSMKYATTLVACSEDAGRSMFGKRMFVVLNNAIDVERYRFNPSVRIQLRIQYGIEDAFVIMMVARWDSLKRFDFAFEVFEQVCRRQKNVKLVLVGLEQKECAGKAKEVFQALPSQVRNNILFLGRKNNVPELLNQADSFLLTSEHEGFGMAVVEAQANGLPCIISDGIPSATKVTDLVEFLPMGCDSERWIEQLLANRKSDEERSRYADKIAAGPFSIKNNSSVLKTLYEVKNDK